MHFQIKIITHTHYTNTCMHSIIISEKKIPTTKCSYLQNIHYRARSSRSHRSHNGDASSLEHQNVNYCFDLMCYTYPEPNSDGRTGPLATLWLYFGQSLDGLRCEITTLRKKTLINLFLVGWKILYSWFFYLRKSYHKKRTHLTEILKQFYFCDAPAI